MRKWVVGCAVLLLGACANNGSAPLDAGVGSDAAVDGALPGNGDVYGPWAGGSAYYKTFSNGPSSSPTYFPIAVWLQDPGDAKGYAAMGVNMFIGLFNDPTDQDLSNFTANHVTTAFDQDKVGLAHLSSAAITAWTQQDEPDNAQSDGKGGYGPCVAPSTIQGLYSTMHENDPTRPVFLNLGRGVADSNWVGRGSCAGQSDYPDYMKGGDIGSFDIYPVNAVKDAAIHDHLEYVGTGVENLRKWSDDKKPIFAWIETTGINDPAGKPTPAQVRSEVWIAIVHGAMGIGYFCHQFSPTLDTRALLHDATMSMAVSAIDQQLTELAPVLNTPPIINAVTVKSSDPNASVDTLLKRESGSTYLFAAAMSSSPTTATFTVRMPTSGDATIEVLGENRTMILSNGVFSDQLDGYGTHIYQITTK